MAGKRFAFPCLAAAFILGFLLSPGRLTARAEDENDGMYTVCFHEDFGEGDGHVFIQEIAFGEATQLLVNPWEHDGYRFAGWYASGCGVNHALANAYGDGETVLDLGRFAGDVIDLYAGWSAEAVNPAETVNPAEISDLAEASGTEETAETESPRTESGD